MRFSGLAGKTYAFGRTTDILPAIGGLVVVNTNTSLRLSSVSMVVLGVAVAVYAQSLTIPPGVDTSKPGIMNDQQFRGIAITAPTPTYPATSLGKGVTGVVVAAILLDRNGHLQSVNVLQTPDDAIGQSVHDALTRWTFRPIGVPMKGKMFFYFTVKKGSGSVASPEEMNPAITQDHRGASNQGDDAVNEIKEAQLELMRKTGKVTVLDIRDRSAYERGHRDGAVNIPIDEVPQRASIELPNHLPLVVDCDPEQPAIKCRVAAQILSYLGFDKVSVLAR
jgi:TonB family protein